MTQLTRGRTPCRVSRPPPSSPLFAEWVKRGAAPEVEGAKANSTATTATSPATRSESATRKRADRTSAERLESALHRPRALLARAAPSSRRAADSPRARSGRRSRLRSPCRAIDNKRARATPPSPRSPRSADVRGARRFLTRFLHLRPAHAGRRVRRRSVAPRRFSSCAAGSDGPITAAPVMYPSRWMPSSPSHRVLQVSRHLNLRSRQGASRGTRGTSTAARTPRAGRRTGVADRLPGRPRSVAPSAPDDREPVVVVGALRAVGRRVGGRASTHSSNAGSELLRVEAHERVPEAVHAAVALPARAGLPRTPRPPPSARFGSMSPPRP